MTANNCAHKANCGDFASFGSFSCLSCRDSKPVIHEPLVFNQSCLSPLLADACKENAQLKREIERLRRSEAKAWRLVKNIVREDDRYIAGKTDDSDALVDRIEEARAALAARKAGA